MSRLVQRADFFEEDFARQFGWYAREAGGTIAWRFQAALHATLRRLADHPDTGRIRHFRSPRLQGLRSAPVNRPFDKLLLFYRATDEILHAVRLIHSARDLPRRLLEPPGSGSP